MLRARKKNKGKLILVVFIFFLAIMVLWFIFLPRDISEESSGKRPDAQMKTDSGAALKFPVASEKDKDIEAEQEKDTTRVKGDIHIPLTIDYQDIEKEQGLTELMEARKKTLGIEKSLDMIVRSDESFVIGGIKVSLQEILKKAFALQGRIYEGNIAELGGSVPGEVKTYGIYVVQPGDNIWNIHFNILKEYYAFRDIKLESTADEPGNQGLSSGVGKILKFSETTVIIYNLVDKEIVKDINLIEPLSKIIIYNLDEVFALLGEINYDNINRIQFDGKNIWIPTQKS